MNDDIQNLNLTVFCIAVSGQGIQKIVSIHYSRKTRKQCADKRAFLSGQFRKPRLGLAFHVQTRSRQRSLQQIDQLVLLTDHLLLKANALRRSSLIHIHLVAPSRP